MASKEPFARFFSLAMSSFSVFFNFSLFKRCNLYSVYVARFQTNYIVGKKAKIRNRYTQVPNLTQDNIWESDKYTRKHHIQKRQEVNPLPAGDHRLFGTKLFGIKSVE